MSDDQTRLLKELLDNQRELLATMKKLQNAIFAVGMLVFTGMMLASVFFAGL